MRSLFLLLITFSVAYSEHVKFMPDKSFNLAINFREHKLPCSKQTVVFPETILESVIIKADVKISGLVLPNNGELILSQEGFEFGADSNDNCTEDGNSYYTPINIYSWTQPDVWSSPRFNEATPDAERVPCYYDIVDFPRDTEFTVKLPEETQYIKGLSVQSIYFDSRRFDVVARYAMAPHFALGTQQFVLNNNGETGIVIVNRQCTSHTGCPCQENMLKIDCSLKFCPPPKCINPIQPIGHCCKICGGYVVLEMGEKFVYVDLEENVRNVLELFGKESLESHIGILPDNKVQIVIVDKGEYVGTSAEAVHAIESKIGDGGIMGVIAQISGSPISKSGLGGKIFVSMFFIAVFTMVAIYVYYYKTPGNFNIRLPIPTMGRSARGMISRFDRRTESVVSLTSRRGSTGTVGSGGEVGTAFRNPLYSSRRGRVDVTESVLEE